MVMLNIDDWRGDTDEIKKKFKNILKGKINNGKKYIKEYLEKNFHIVTTPQEKKVSVRSIGKIYFVSGILHKPIKTKIWRKVLEEKFPKIKKQFFDTVFYTHIEHQKIEKILDKLSKSIRDFFDKKIQRRVDETQKEGSEKILIIAHSFGGILSKTAIAKLPLKYQKNIVLITMGTPHTMNYGGVKEAKNFLKTPENLKENNIYTFGGIYDPVVPAKYSHTEKSIKRDVPIEHIMFLYKKTILENILSEVFFDIK